MATHRLSSVRCHISSKQMSASQPLVLLLMFHIISLYEVLKVHCQNLCSYFVFGSYSPSSLASRLLSSLLFAKGIDMPTTRFILRLRLVFTKFSGYGAEGIRTPDPLLARQVLSQLSYNPLGSYGLKWTRTTDLTLIRRAL